MPTQLTALHPLISYVLDLLHMYALYSYSLYLLFLTVYFFNYMNLSLTLSPPLLSSFFFFLNDPATPEIYPLPLHDPLPIWTDQGITAELTYEKGRIMKTDTPDDLDFSLAEFHQHLVEAVNATVKLYRGIERHRVMPAGSVEIGRAHV